MIFGVIFAMTFITLLVWMVFKLFANDSQEILVKFVVMIFTALVGVYVVDKVIAFKISLLSEEEDKSLFDLIKTLVLLIFSYYFGTKSVVKK
jgi:hypothetical protein